MAIRRNDRLEVLDLLAAPTDALRQVRRKAEQGRVLSRAEWTVVAHFAQQGVETSAPNRILTASLIAVLDAFAAVYDLRRRPDTRREAYYLGNLPLECRPAGMPGKPLEAPTPETVRMAVAETRRRLRERTAPFFPLLVARNLRVLLAEDTLPDAEVIHQPLRRHWPVLSRLAARGPRCRDGADR